MLASFDSFDADYRIGQQVTNCLYLINGSWNDAKFHVDLLLMTESPEFILEAECLGKPMARWSFDLALKLDSVEKQPGCPPEKAVAGSSLPDSICNAALIQLSPAMTQPRSGSCSSCFCTRSSAMSCSSERSTDTFLRVSTLR